MLRGERRGLSSFPGAEIVSKLIYPSQRRPARTSPPRGVASRNVQQLLSPRRVTYPHYLLPPPPQQQQQPQQQHSRVT